jgi:predicted DNA-binding antitoxin AbrB/MazE fold protein
MTVSAIFEHGVLRPIKPLALKEGESVQLTIHQSNGKVTQPLSEDEITRRLKEASTIQEWLAATQLLPSDDGGYDIVEALNDNRLRTGERPFLAK